jgi:hypothetical protein
VPTFTYAQSADLEKVEQILTPRMEGERPIFQYLPTVTEDVSVIAWEQEDDYLGLQQVRGLNGQPPRVKKTGAKRYQMEPGVYGEYEPVNEADLVLRRRYGSFGDPVSIDDLVAPIQVKLLNRRFDRIEWMGWTLLITGTFSVAGPSGAILHTDSYTVQTYTASTVWSTFATSTPLADFSAVQLLARGYAVDFGAKATAYMNRATFNNLRSNTNSADIGGRRTQGLGSVNNMADLNKLFTGDDLPNIAVYDKGYKDDTGTFQLFIPNNKVVVIGQRLSGVAIGSYVYTRNVNNANLAPGPYTKVIDTGEEAVPRNIEVHDGHSGGFKLTFPSAVVVMTV